MLATLTLLSNDQFNTTIYGYDDRFRGISGTRKVPAAKSVPVRLSLAG